MLAAPLYPTSSFSPLKPGEETQLKPTKDLEAFNALLPPIEFIEGSSTGSIFDEANYTPINASPRSKNEKLPPQSPSPGKNVAVLSPSVKKTRTKGVGGSTDQKSLYTGPIDTTWPPKSRVGRGFNNTGNTCFLNSALQCLLHTAPLVRILSDHRKEICRVKNSFCMICALRQTMVDSQTKFTSTPPYLIITKLQLIAKHMRRGRQEDSHEFLRYAIDALQKSCLYGYPPKLDPKLAETTWVHQIFGGRLRSRVTCGECDYNSDTLDRILDLSIDIFGVNSVRDALRKFVAVDHLKGANKYKCEKCKKPVLAEKQFTIHEAPMVLTIHLKRFSPMGRKIGHPLRYDERLPLQPYMSEGTFGPSYSLFGVICHAGGGPNSGHYYAYVKDGQGGWHEMNDESVTPTNGPPLSLKNAYVLFYLRDKGQALESAISSAREPSKGGLVAGMKKRKLPHEADEDTGVRTSPVASRPATPAKFIGPLLPSPDIPSPSKKRKAGDSQDPQAEALRKKIEAVTERTKEVKEEQVKKAPAPASAFQSLSQYAEDDDDGDEGEAPSQEEIEKAKEKLPVPVVASAIPTSNFYGGGSGNATPFKNKSNFQQPGPLKRDRPEGAGVFRKKKSFASSPFDRLSGGNINNLQRAGVQQYGKKKRRPII
ncbi:Usp36 protein [Thelephora terrestris]|uniref:Ubiquitin carboxyl-terminal hydrolase n=1 Tax=Thelephora terrestris TaxID=56493 RepID=A0A9P6H6G0_9AGAM|nr:Usp36 protein [Thelephora terrestris]